MYRIPGVAICLMFLLSGASAQDMYTVSLSSGSGAAGAEVEIIITLDFADGDPVQGWQWGICHDDEVLTLEEGEVYGTEIIDDLDFTFTNVTIHSEPGASGWTGGYLLNVVSMDTLAPADGYDLFDMDYTVNDDAEVLTTTDIEWCENLGAPPVANLIVAGGEEVDLATVDGSITIVDPVDEPLFLRGDTNNNGTVTALVDAVHLLEFGFGGGPAPDCLDAADADDDGVVFSLIDALYILAYGFTDGPEPPAPGADECGVDATDDDDVACEETGCS